MASADARSRQQVEELEMAEEEHKEYGWVELDVDNDSATIEAATVGIVNGFGGRTKPTSKNLLTKAIAYRQALQADFSAADVQLEVELGLH
jgi:hypothetical protein